MKQLTADQAKLGFIGLGNMGSRIALRLLDHGYQLTVYDRDPSKGQAIVAKGGVVAKSILELAQTCEVLLSCLTGDEAVQRVYMGSEGVFAVARPGTVVLEMSTISPEGSRKLHKLGARVGIEVMDVAISGSTPVAEEGHSDAARRWQPGTLPRCQANIPGDCKTIPSYGWCRYWNNHEVGRQYAAGCWYAGDR